MDWIAGSHMQPSLHPALIARLVGAPFLPLVRRLLEEVLARLSAPSAPFIRNGERTRYAPVRAPRPLAHCPRASPEQRLDGPVLGTLFSSRFSKACWIERASTPRRSDNRRRKAETTCYRCETLTMIGSTRHEGDDGTYYAKMGGHESSRRANACGGHAFQKKTCKRIKPRRDPRAEDRPIPGHCGIHNVSKTAERSVRTQRSCGRKTVLHEPAPRDEPGAGDGCLWSCTVVGTASASGGWGLQEACGAEIWEANNKDTSQRIVAGRMFLGHARWLTRIKRVPAERRIEVRRVTGMPRVHPSSQAPRTRGSTSIPVRPNLKRRGYDDEGITRGAGSPRARERWVTKTTPGTDARVIASGVQAIGRPPDHSYGASRLDMLRVRMRRRPVRTLCGRRAGALHRWATRVCAMGHGDTKVASGGRRPPNEREQNKKEPCPEFSVSQ
ncbi:hypothetical protein DFH07DRAFT_954679 [Mycena maculata]|uniref:Uncharacterized protein n=1 Tax=Mycena maculata TaxID=230809 RepID=A0AAD7JMJ3_9AGAR|nr:hypothetical protein DFH07DRAFT_954679 [Mycena maculata]